MCVCVAVKNSAALTSALTRVKALAVLPSIAFVPSINALVNTVKKITAQLYYENSFDLENSLKGSWVPYSGFCEPHFGNQCYKEHCNTLINGPSPCKEGFVFLRTVYSMDFFHFDQFFLYYAQCLFCTLFSETLVRK